MATSTQLTTINIFDDDGRQRESKLIISNDMVRMLHNIKHGSYESI